MEEIGKKKKITRSLLIIFLTIEIKKLNQY